MTHGVSRENTEWIKSPCAHMRRESRVLSTVCVCVCVCVRARACTGTSQSLRTRYRLVLAGEDRYVRITLYNTGNSIRLGTCRRKRKMAKTLPNEGQHQWATVHVLATTFTFRNTSLYKPEKQIQSKTEHYVSPMKMPFYVVLVT
jgi:hypothetical protein